MITFDEAKHDELRRQDYLDIFFKQNPDRNVSALVYNIHRKPSLDKITEMQFADLIDTDMADAMRLNVYQSTSFAFLLITGEMLGKNHAHTIFVNSRAFTDLDENDFRYNIVDHEYFHATDFRHGIPLPNGVIIDYTNSGLLQYDTLEGIIDTRALIYQMLKGREKGIHDSQAFMNAIKGFLKYHHQLKSVNPGNDFEREVIKAQIQSYQSLLPNHLREK
ncbi:MAG: hypothetical protein ACMXYG_07525 [Candidatus Woesearchaeota archaeon]